MRGKKKYKGLVVSFGVWLRRERCFFHFQLTMAESTAMTATPQKMSRICRRDCLVKKRKKRHRIMDVYKIESTNFNITERDTKSSIS